MNSVERLSLEGFNTSQELSEETIRNALLRNQERLIKDYMGKTVREIPGPKHKQHENEVAPKISKDMSVEWEDSAPSGRSFSVSNDHQDKENTNENVPQNAFHSDLKRNSIAANKAKYIDLKRYNIRAPFAHELTHPTSMNHGGNFHLKSINFVNPFQIKSLQSRYLVSNVSLEPNLLKIHDESQNEPILKPIERRHTRSMTDFGTKLEESVVQYRRHNSYLLPSNETSEELEYKKKLEERLKIRQQQLEEMNRLIFVYKKQVDELQQESLPTLKGCSKSMPPTFQSSSSCLTDRSDSQKEPRLNQPIISSTTNSEIRDTNKNLVKQKVAAVSESQSSAQKVSNKDENSKEYFVYSANL